jgi:signal transduction histidine kinase
VNNLVKHSECRNAELVFSVDGPYLMVSISDDGKGFKPAEPGKMAVWEAMAWRTCSGARAIGGSLKIDSEIGRGTKVTLRVPIRQSSRWLPWPFSYPNGR